MATLLYKRKDGTYGRINQYMFGSTPVVQETGDSLVYVMSQKAVTDEINLILEKLEAIYIPTKVSEFENDAKYQTEDDVNARIKELIGTAPEALDTLGEIADKLAEGSEAIEALNQVLEGKVNKEDLDDYYTKSEIDWGKDELVNEFEQRLEDIDERFDEVYDIEEIESILGDFVKKDELPEGYDDTEIKDRLQSLESIDHSQFATKEELKDVEIDLSDYYKKSEVDKKIAEAVTGGEIDLEGYATKEDLKKYYTKDEASSAFATKEDLENVEVDLDDYYTKSEVDKKISEIETSGNVDLSNYYTKDEIDAFKFVSEDDVITRGDLDDIFGDDYPSLDAENYYTKDEIENKFYDKKTIDEKLSQIEGGEGSYDDTELKNRIEALESKESYDDSELRGRIETLEGKEEYDDTDIKQRIAALEGKEDKDTVYDDAEIKRQLQDLNSKVEDIEIPSIEGLASKEWVLLQEYMTNDDLDGYMGDINDSLGELKEAVKNAYDDSELRGRIETLEGKVDSKPNIWTGSQGDYDSIGNKDNNTIYIILSE